MFKLIAIRPLEGCRDSALKCLKIGQLYYLCNDYTITEDGISMRDNYVRLLPKDFFSPGYGSQLQVNIAAIVGMNGDGKSSLVELVMRLVNNCAKHYNLTDKDHLLRVEDIKAELFYEIDNVVYCIRESKDDNYTNLLKYADIRDRSVRQWKKLMAPVKGVSKLNELFYTIVSNYSHYAYNTNDFREEWNKKIQVDEESERCWLHYLFHKNDGYLTPITIHPFRDKGNLDINRETDLTMQRLISLYIQEPSPKENKDSFRRIGEKDAEILNLTDAGSSKLQEKTIYQYLKDSKTVSLLSDTVNKIEDLVKNYDDKIEEDLHDNKLEVIEMCLDLLTGENDTAYKKYLEGFFGWIGKKRKLYSSKSDVRLLLNAMLKFKNNVGDDLPYLRLSYKYKRYDKLNVKQLTRLRYVYNVMQCWGFQPDILLKDYNELTDVERCQHYIVYKTIDICQTYPRYRDMMNEAESGWNGNSLVLQENVIADIIGMLRQDKSHVTLKLRQCLNFMEERREKQENPFEVLDRKTTEKKLRKKYKESLLVRFDELKAYYKVDPFPLDLLPPPIYNQEVLYRSLVKEDEFMPYRYLSSGEKQLLNNLGAIFYHIRNIDSVSVEGKKYENLNILLEEIELYFHPDYQRKIVKMLLDKIHAIKFKSVQRINFIFVTHSPFILSDIPLCNVLFLKEGKPNAEMMQENTFGANINGMLRNGFFLPSLPIGEFAHEKINMLFERLNGFKLDARDQEQADWFYSNIMRVGEPYLREQLMKLYNMHYRIVAYD